MSGFPSKNVRELGSQVPNFLHVCSGLKPKNENDPKEEDDLRWNTTFDGRRPLTEDDLFTADELRRKTTLDMRRPLTEDQTCKKSGTWEPSSRTFFEKNPDIFQKSKTRQFVKILLRY